MKRLILAILAALALAWSTSADLAEANGAPVTINLSYLPGVSNWGPQDASGVAEVVLAEEEVQLEVDGLPRLSGEAYEVWLANTAGGDWLSVGRFNVDDTGKGDLEESITLPAGLPEYPYDLVVISVEAESDSNPAPSQKLSLAGYFPGTHGLAASTATATSVGPVQGTVPVAAPVADATVVPTARAANVTGTPGLVPSKLPKTGEPAASWLLLALGGLLLVVGGVVRATVAERRRR